MYDESDRQFMSRALALAARALYDAAPNPRVGCVIVREGRVIGEGWTQPPGSNHAEIEALLDARRNGHDVRGATVYVSLEPCSHFGRTPPCSTALIEAHVGRVIAAVEDPNPLVAGSGLEMLRSAGIDVRCGLLEQEAAEINVGFFSRMQRGRPWVRMKIAASLDGKTALENGVSKWITSEEARRDGHAWRARAVCGADRHRHRAGGQPATRCAAGGNDAPATARAGRQSAGSRSWCTILRRRGQGPGRHRRRRTQRGKPRCAQSVPTWSNCRTSPARSTWLR